MKFPCGVPAGGHDINWTKTTAPVDVLSVLDTFVLLPFTALSLAFHSPFAVLRCPFTALQVDVPSVGWVLAGGAASVGSKIKGQTDIRSGGPGQTTMAIAADSLSSFGHTITGGSSSAFCCVATVQVPGYSLPFADEPLFTTTAATVTFQYISGYGCESPTNCADAANVTLALVTTLPLPCVPTCVGVAHSAFCCGLSGGCCEPHGRRPYLGKSGAEQRKL